MLNYKYNLEDFEKDSRFRADVLFFILRINSFFESIFWDKFFNNKDKRKNLREEVEKYNEDKLENKYKNMDQHLKQALEYKGRVKDRPYIDCLGNEDFAGILNFFPKELKERQTDILKQEFGIFLEHDAFTATLTIFRKKRNYFEHYFSENKFNKNKKQNENDEKIIQTMALYLLPEMRGLFMGCLKSAKKRIIKKSPKLKEKLDKIIDDTDKIFFQVKEEKADNRRRISEDTRKKENLYKEQRKSLEAKSAEYQRKIRGFCRLHQYNLQNFKERYHFIGESTIKNIDELINNEQEKPTAKLKQITSNDKPDFKYDFESLYYLSTRINLTMYFYIYDILSGEEKREMDTLSRKQWDKRKKALKKENIKPIEKKYKDLVNIRNKIAHNSSFWDIFDDNDEEGLKKIFTIIFDAIKEYHPKNISKEIANNFYTEILSLCRKYSHTIAIPTGDDAKGKSIERINPWSLSNRKKYKNEKDYIINRRPFIRPVIAIWVNGLHKANPYKKVKNEKKRDK